MKIKQGELEVIEMRFQGIKHADLKAPELETAVENLETYKTVATEVRSELELVMDWSREHSQHFRENCLVPAQRHERDGRGGDMMAMRRIGSKGLKKKMPSYHRS